MAQTVLDAVLKCLKKFVKVDEQFEVLKATWTASMNNLEANDHITESIPWLPVPTSSGRRREAMNDPQVSARNTERDVRENVPQILHPDWTAADRKRANEVNTQKRSRTPVLIFLGPTGTKCDFGRPRGLRLCSPPCNSHTTKTRIEPGFGFYVLHPYCSYAQVVSDLICETPI